MLKGTSVWRREGGHHCTGSQPGGDRGPLGIWGATRRGDIEAKESGISGIILITDGGLSKLPRVTEEILRSLHASPASRPASRTAVTVLNKLQEVERTRHQRSKPPFPPYYFFREFWGISRVFGIFRDLNTVGGGVFDNKREWELHPSGKERPCDRERRFFVQLCCTFLGERRDEGKVFVFSLVFKMTSKVSQKYFHFHHPAKMAQNGFVSFLDIFESPPKAFIKSSRDFRIFFAGGVRIPLVLGHHKWMCLLHPVWRGLLGFAPYIVRGA